MVRRPAGVALMGALVLLGCGEETQLGRIQPVISVEAERIDFGLVAVGATKRVRLTVGNVGTADLTVSSIATTAPGVDPSLGPFSVGATEARIAPGSQRVVDVIFKPRNDEAATGSVVIASDDPETPQVAVELTGQGADGLLLVQPEVLPLRETTVGRSRAVEIVVRNLDIAPIAGARLVTEGFERPEHFRLTGLARFEEPEPFALDARGRQVLTLTYEPLDVGEDGGVIRIETCGPRCGPEVLVDAAANEAVLRLDPPSIDFGRVGIGETRSESMEVANVGNMAATIESVTAAGDAAFGVDVPSGMLPRTLEPGQRLGVTVQYAPVDATRARGSVVVRTNLGSAPELQASLVGEGQGPLFLVEPELVSFAERGPGRYQRAVLLVNAGSSQVQVSSIGLTGDPELSLGPLFGLPARVGPGESLIVQVVFRPTVIGQFSATLSIATDDPMSPMVTVPVTATMNEALCELRLSPSRLLLGVLPPGNERVRSVTVTNIGNDTCRLESGAFRAPLDPEITLLSTNPALPLDIVPATSTVAGAVTEVELRFRYAPTQPRSAKATYVLTTSDIFFPERTVSVSGQSDPYPQLLVRPPAIDFGRMTPIICPQFVEQVTLFNVGQVAVRHRSSSLTTPSGAPASTEFQILPGTGFDGISPLLPVGESVTYELGYLATAVEPPDLAELEIVLDGFPQPIVVPLTGEGSAQPERVERFEQDDNKEVDVLFVIDDSCSMFENQQQVAANIDQFIRAADQRQVDFQIGITTTDTNRIPGALVGPVISRMTPSFQAVFRNQAAVGVNGSGFERGLEAMRGALEEAARGTGFNADLIRTDAALVVIIVSDEDDQSALSPTQYANDLQSRAPTGLLAAAVTGQRTGCSSPAGIADPSPRYENFLSFFGNSVSASICADWGQTLADLGGEAFGLRRAFRLTVRPASVPEPIVEVNGTRVLPPAFQVVGQEIVFANPPPEGAEIIVRYSPDC